MEKEKIAELFMKGIDCSQVVVGAFAEKLGITQEEAYKMAAGFGGGMGIGETCGAVVGAMIVLGLKFGQYGVCSCKGLLKHDIADPEGMQKILEEGLLFDFCPKIVRDTIEILNEVV